MIRLWTSAHSSASIREQLSAQLLLGILSGRLAAGERLPSVRGLAKRLGIHPNTMHLVYRDLAERGWLQTRKGSGVFVKEQARPNDGVATFVSEWLSEAERRGFTVEAIEAELSRRGQASPAGRHLLVVDPDGELARIMAAEMSSVLGQPVAWSDADQVVGAIRSDSRVIVNSGHADQLAPLLAGYPLERIRLNSMEALVAGQKKPDRPVLVGVVSRSETVLEWASTLLSALGIPSECVLLRSPDKCLWTDGLHACDILATDVCAATQFPKGLTPIVFHVVAEESLAALSSTCDSVETVTSA